MQYFTPKDLQIGSLFNTLKNNNKSLIFKDVRDINNELVYGSVG